MKKITLFLLSLIAFALPGLAETTTVTESFNTVGAGCGNYKLIPSALPEGWGAWGAVVDNNARMGWYSYNGYENTACIRMASDPSSYGESGLVTYVKAGKIKFGAKTTAASYNSDTRGYLKICKMSKGDDGKYSIVGDPLYKCSKYSELTTVSGTAINNSSMEFVEFDIPEDMYVGVIFSFIYFDEFSNTYEAAASAFDVTGTVKDEEGNAIVGATVTIAGLDPVTSDENGAWTIPAVPADELAISCTAPGYKTYTSSITAEEGITRDIVLEQVQSTLTIKAMELNNSITLTDAVFNLYQGETPIQENVAVDENGLAKFTIKGLLNEEGYKITGSSVYCKPYSADVAINSTSTSAYTLTFKYGEDVTKTAAFTAKTLSFKATVLNEEQEYVTNATVTLTGGDNTVAMANNGDGTYVNSGVINAVKYAGVEMTATCVVPDMKPIEPVTFQFNGEDHEVSFAAVAWQPTTVMGFVYGENIETPLEGASVTLLDGETEVGTATTDENGVYSITFEGAVAESYSVKVVAPYYNELTLNDITVEREGTATADATLEKTMYTFTAFVTDENSVAIEEPEVYLGEDLIAADEEGNYVAYIWAGDAANNAEFTAMAAAYGYEVAEYTFSYTEGETAVEHTFVLDPTMYSFTANVMNADEEAIADATVKVKDAEGNLLEVANNEDGSYTYSCAMLQLPEGPFTVAISAEGYESTTDEFNFRAMQTNIVRDYVLTEKDYTFTLTVYGSDKAPVTDATVTIINGDERTEAANLGEGVYSFTAGAVQSAGITYSCEVEAAEHITATIEFDFADGSVEREITLVSGVGSILKGEGVQALGGKLFINGNARIFSVDGKLVKVINNNGAEEVTGLQPGLYIVNGQKVILK